MPDIEKLLEIRRWFEAAAGANGAEVDETGIAFKGQADISFEFGGRRYWVRIEEDQPEMDEREANDNHIWQ